VPTKTGVLVDEMGRRLQQRPSVSPLTALGHALREAFKNLASAWYGFWYTYRKHRRRGVPYLLSTPLSDPVVTAGETVGVGEVMEDEPTLVIYKTESGKLFTQDMLEGARAVKDPKTGKTRHVGPDGEPLFFAGERITYAHEVSDERAEELVGQLEAMRMETDLSEHDLLLLKTLQKHLASRYA